MSMVHLSTIQLSDNVEQKVSITRVKKEVGYTVNMYRKADFTQEL